MIGPEIQATIMDKRRIYGVLLLCLKNKKG